MTVHVVKFIDTVFTISFFFNRIIMKSPDIFMEKHLALLTIKIYKLLLMPRLFSYLAPTDA